jgi:hypothetical protein
MHKEKRKLFQPEKFGCMKKKSLNLRTVTYIKFSNYGSNQFGGITQQYGKVSGYSQRGKGCYPKEAGQKYSFCQHHGTIFRTIFPAPLL